MSMAAEPEKKIVKREEKGDKQPSFVDKTKRFLVEVRTEMRKVNTPSQKEVRATTGVVLVTVFLFAAYFYAVDKGIGAIIDTLLRWAKG
jgi:preprotein translocase subunit SecE